MSEFARGGGPLSVVVVALISTVIAIAVGFWLKRLLWAGGNPAVPQHYARIWAGWAVVAVCATQLAHLINFPSVDSLARLLVGIVVFCLIGFAAGWLYGKLFKSNVTTASTQSSSSPSFQLTNRRHWSYRWGPAHCSAVANNAVPNSTIANTHPAPQSTRVMSIDEDAIYAAVANEIESGQTDKGLWTRLYVENDGDEKKTKLAYIKQRTEKMIADERARIEERLRLEREA